MTDNIDHETNRLLFLEWQEKVKKGKEWEVKENNPLPSRHSIYQEQPSPRSSQTIDTTQIDAEKAFLAFLGKNADLAMEDHRPGFWSTDKELSILKKHVGETISERIHRLRKDVPQVLKSTFNLISQTEFLKLKSGRESDLVVKGNFTIFKGILDAEDYTKKMVSVNPSLQKRFYGSNPAHAMLFDLYKPKKAVALNSIPSQKIFSKRPNSNKIYPLSINSRILRMAKWGLAGSEILKTEARIDAMRRLCGPTKHQNMKNDVQTLVKISREVLDTSTISKIQVQCQLASLSLGYVHPVDSNEESSLDDDNGEKEIQAVFEKINSLRNLADNLEEIERKSGDSLKNFSFISRIENYEKSLKALEARLTRMSTSIESLLQSQKKSVLE